MREQTQSGAKVQVDGHPELNAIALALWDYNLDLAKALITSPLSDVDAIMLDDAGKDTVAIDWYVNEAREHFKPWLHSTYPEFVVRGEEALKKLDEIEQLIAERRRSKRE